MVQPCFATEFRGLARSAFGKRKDPQGRKVLLICSYFSPTLKKQAVEGNAAVECVYFALAALEEQSLATVLG